MFGLSLRDVLTRVLPGFLMLLPLLIVLFLLQPGLFDHAGILFLLVLISSLLTGEVADQMRSAVGGVPRDFQRYIASEVDDPSRRPFFDRYAPWFRSFFQWLATELNIPSRDPVDKRSDMDFRGDIEERFQVKYQNDTTRDIYDLLLLHLDPHLSGRTRRYQSIYILSANAKIGLLLSLFFYFVIAMSERNSELWEPTFIAFLIALVFLSLWWGMFKVLELAQGSFLDLLFKEYYLQHGSER